MLKRRLIPKIQVRMVPIGNRIRPASVTTVGFITTREVGDPVSQAKIYEAQITDELVVLNLDPSAQTERTFIETVESISEVVFMPLTVGGGVSTLENFYEFLEAGADKVSVNSSAVRNPGLINEAATRFGAQCVVLSLDVKQSKTNKYEAFIDGGKTATGLDAISWAKEAEQRGAGEILITSIDRDGLRSGLDTALIAAVANVVSVPVIASGGCGLASHFIDGFRSGASAVAAGTFFAFQDQNPIQTRSHIRNAGIPIRVQL